MALIDEAQILVESGAGGRGCVSFRREKFIPYGGPNGGNGGRGGSVYLAATRNKQSLLDFKFLPKFVAERGEHGLGSDMDGRGGEDLILEVPLGTVVTDPETGEIIADLTHDGEKILVAPGGNGGRGNLSFKSSTNRAPRNSTPGGPGVEKNLKLELKLLADIGLVGLPNAGKSSFLSCVSRAKPKIADYPFTTLEPHLGVVQRKGMAFVIADLPGLIEGAADGAGLGHRFLKHVTRNRVLLHLVEVTPPTDEILKRIETIRKELVEFDPQLAERKEILLFTKCDLLSAEDLAAKEAEIRKAGLNGYFISSQSHLGTEKLLDDLTEQAQTWHANA